MGCCESCLGEGRSAGDDRDPMLDAAARARAAEAAEARQAKFATSAHGKAAAKQAARDKAQIGQAAHQERIRDIIS
eukprot:CAMPEP_0115861158 /NCGR_PEP_ID=MMETSP0287-20121206/17509_1 /TAXON_ID=412157 /ORGANISM="Chrysochromulina rotalis, Strain UIO044" /LENGTH=75 /DNA_ID=CAMNT_0003315525 /DNA_START=77 /DNA_END=304 /DNA_ORIENTATION=-